MMSMLFAVSFGLGQMQDQSATAKPQNPATWFSPNDYPAAAQRAGAEGRVGFVVRVDAAGKPTDCHVKSSSGSAPLDDITCSLILEKGSFEPAKDRAGRPIAGEWSSATSWKLPDPPSIDVTNGPVHHIMTVRAAIDPDGHVTSCTVTRDGQSIEPDSCYMFIRSDGALPISKDGKPVAGTMTFTSEQTYEARP